MSISTLYNLSDNPETEDISKKFYKGLSTLFPLALELKSYGDSVLPSEEASAYQSYLGSIFEQSYNQNINTSTMFLGMTGNSASSVLMEFIESGRLKYGIEELDYDEIGDFYSTINTMPNIEDPFERSAELMQYIETKKSRLVGENGLLVNADILVDDIFNNFTEEGNFITNITGEKNYIGDIDKDLLSSELDTIITPPQYGKYAPAPVDVKFKDKRVRKDTQITPDDLYEPRIDILAGKNLKKENLGDLNQYLPTDDQLSKLINSVESNMDKLDNDNYIVVKKNLPRYIETMNMAKTELDNIKNVKGILDLQIGLARGKYE